MHLRIRLPLIERINQASSGNKLKIHEPKTRTVDHVILCNKNLTVNVARLNISKKLNL